jgi:hypothetical protein
MCQQSVEDFYRGKKIDMIIGYSSGGTYDLYARLVARYLGNYIPGKPLIVPRNMPGAGSRAAANWVYNIAPRDGTVLATADQSLSLQQAAGDKRINFDTTKFIYIGNPNVENNTTAAWHTSGIKTIDDAKRREVTVGATGGSTSSQYPKAMNALIGTKFKIVLGYPGGNDVNLALERGEVDVRGSNSWTSWKATRPDWIAEKKINILVQIGLAKARDLPDIRERARSYLSERCVFWVERLLAATRLRLRAEKLREEMVRRKLQHSPLSLLNNPTEQPNIFGVTLRHLRYLGLRRRIQSTTQEQYGRLSAADVPRAPKSRCVRRRRPGSERRSRRPRPNRSCV